MSQAWVLQYLEERRRWVRSVWWWLVPGMPVWATLPGLGFIRSGVPEWRRFSLLGSVAPLCLCSLGWLYGGVWRPLCLYRGVEVWGVSLLTRRGPAGCPARVNTVDPFSGSAVTFIHSCVCYISYLAGSDADQGSYPCPSGRPPKHSSIEEGCTT